MVRLGLEKGRKKSSLRKSKKKRLNISEKRNIKNEVWSGVLNAVNDIEAKAMNNINCSLNSITDIIKEHFSSTKDRSFQTEGLY